MVFLKQGWVDLLPWLSLFRVPECEMWSQRTRGSSLFFALFRCSLQICCYFCWVFPHSSNSEQKFSFFEDFSNAHAQPIHPLGYRGLAILVYLKVVSCISPHFSYLGSVAIKRRSIATPPQCACLVKKTKRGWGANCIGRSAFLYDFLNLFSSPATQFNIVPRYYSHLCYFLS